ncbi:MAG: 16S rRNA (guanine(966)-N(2))-methyltransferase RsmD [Candidatus Bipolaricaulota bacterium]|nr:16S rRNA (guanine(966)-N(2))-methyltransferase RsmD [Candidatus Bipolaricaulota bacterium]MDW8126537.1 16S rRNA (guanine(966)-N(2))-methyltransferase RsmD [Candidatus Bipolaricaulota bacterium]
MRIIGGEQRGRRLVHWQGENIRPLRDRVRTALFDTLGEAVVGAHVLDLFAGTGAVGLEALSRGAAHATFVDSSEHAVRIIRENVARLGYGERVEIIREDAAKAVRNLARKGWRFDLVFVGAPYATGLAAQALQALAENLPLRPGAMVVAETFHKDALGDVFPPLRLVEARSYGETRLTYFLFGQKEGSR